MKNFIVILLLVITSFTNFVNAQNDSLTKKFKSIKTYTLGDRFEKKGWTPKFDDFGKAICYLDRISLGNFKDVELNIYLNDDGTIYKLNAEGMSCGSSMD
ncbi:MAG: hypothetical protein KDD24_08830, partial [Flavobacteriales bacterium]|nr:hypothetical protein [Flavobacteriales bacterium]